MLGRKYLITYTLRTPNWDYRKFYAAIQSLGNWWHYLDTTWAIKDSVYTTNQMYDKLASGLSTKDSILIVEIVQGTSYGFLPKDAWDWLNS
jgi:hypothetical protein